MNFYIEYKKKIQAVKIGRITLNLEVISKNTLSPSPKIIDQICLQPKTSKVND